MSYIKCNFFIPIKKVVTFLICIHQTLKLIKLLKTNFIIEENIMTEHLTKQDFLNKVFNYEQNQEWKFEGDKPCIIDFYADWCQPCKIVAPILEEISEEYKGKLNVYKVDTEKEQELAAVFGIRSIPSMLFVPMNDKPQMAVGALPKDSLIQAMKEVLGVDNEAN